MFDCVIPVCAGYLARKKEPATQERWEFINVSGATCCLRQVRHERDNSPVSLRSVNVVDEGERRGVWKCRSRAVRFVSE